MGTMIIGQQPKVTFSGPKIIGTTFTDGPVARKIMITRQKIEFDGPKEINGGL